MPHQFITNTDKLLAEVFNNILPSSKSLYFLVGYFYFSGFEEIYKNLEDKNIKILVGLDAEKDLLNKIREFEIIDETNHSRGEIRLNFHKNFVTIFNDTDFFDSVEKQEAFKLFIEKIKNGTLEIRKTLRPNHSKLYLFENKDEYSQGGEFPGTLITGSSNLSRSGLRGQHEINVIFRDEHFKEGLELFNRLWEEAVLIVNKDNFNEFEEKVIHKIWIDKLPSPYLLYLRVLIEYFTIEKRGSIAFPSDITGEKFKDLKYQIDAVTRAINILEQHNGVIIADVVGLGKSIIASAIAYNLKLRTIIIAPPHLISQWSDYSYEFNFRTKIYSSGKIAQALEENDDDELKLIIIDEAHKYRNENTNDYALLHQLCQKNKVILLSATPFNNRPQDIFALIRLFQITAKSTIRTVDNLSYQFREMVKEYKKIKESQRKKTKSNLEIKNEIEILADKIRDILSPLIIRRSRIDLDLIDEYIEDLKSQNISFPKVNDPVVLEYKLGDLAELYISTFYKIAPQEEGKGFIGARYMPANYIKNIEKYKQKISEEFDDVNLFKQAQRNIADFMKHLLVRRFESSIEAFAKSLDSMIASSEYIKDWYERLGKVPIYKKGNLPSIEELFDLEGEDAEIDLTEINFEEQLASYTEKGLFLIDKKELKLDFIRDLDKDINLLKSIKSEWFGKGYPEDPKLKDFKKILKSKLKEMPSRKIVVFTEFSDTADYLYKELKNEFRVFKYSSKDASLSNKETIRRNFDAGIKEQLKLNDYDILIATDAISEGFNLHRAGIIFNYDIPYNPTRVIQRVGRINRINKKVFDELFIYNFFPSAEGQQHTFVTQIASLKLTMIQALIGEDTKVLTSDEELRSYFVERFREEMKEQEAKESWDAKFLNELNKIKTTNPELYRQAIELPRRIRIKRSKTFEQKGVLVFGKKGNDYIFKLGTSPVEYQSLNARDAISLFKADIDEKAEPVSNEFEATYQKVKENLFTKKNEVALDKGKRETIDKLKFLIDNKLGNPDYLKDLLFVVAELDSLPELYHRQIRKISDKTINSDLEYLMKEIPHSYLINIIKKAEQIDEAEENLILAEELNPS
ncbi:helicase-related protein [Ignavibacterium sp.]|uniref:helicase-related protein n=1 Tax=Ignavibacterium sp. TaxID=2651167 RepID=UPI0022083C77|nr:helicase-related protein [Ignavibacterium sp.]BDQ02296.1 MAG: ATP-dependent helicase [Ignavibacterium sp.]